MIEYAVDRILDWLSFEPVILFLMIITAVVLFLQVYKTDKKEEIASFWLWLKRLLEALAKALLFLGILWAFRAILNYNYSNFINTHGRVSEANYYSVQNIWGGPHVQRELSIAHYIEETFIEEIPREDLSKPPLYREVIETVEVEQNSIRSFEGVVHLTPNKRQKGSAFYNGFETELCVDYHIINDSNYETDAHFYLPWSTNQPLYNEIVVLENGKDLSGKLRFYSDHLSWQRIMIPFEEINIRVSYKTRGLEYFYYQIPFSREIKDFSLKVIVDNLPITEVNYPEGCLPPTEEIVPTEDGKGSVLEWRFNKASTTAGMGIALSRPEQPGERVALALDNSTSGLMLLIVAVCLTLILWGRRINLLEIMLLGAVYIILYLTMSSISDFCIFGITLGFLGSYIIGVCCTLLLSSLLIIAKTKGLVMICLLSLMGFYTLIYPLFSLVEDLQINFSGIMVILLIIYLFLLAIYIKVGRSQTEK